MWKFDAEDYRIREWVIGEDEARRVIDYEEMRMMFRKEFGREFEELTNEEVEGYNKGRMMINV